MKTLTYTKTNTLTFLKKNTNNLQKRYGVLGGTLLSTIINISLHNVVFTAIITVMVQWLVMVFLRC